MGHVLTSILQRLVIGCSPACVNRLLDDLVRELAIVPVRSGTGSRVLYHRTGCPPGEQFIFLDTDFSAPPTASRECAMRAALSSRAQLASSYITFSRLLTREDGGSAS